MVPRCQARLQILAPGALAEAAMVAACFIGMGYYGVRLKWTSGSESSGQTVSPRLGVPVPLRARYWITALKPVTICATVEVAKTERHLAGGRRSNTKERPAWIKLKAGDPRQSRSCLRNSSRVRAARTESLFVGCKFGYGTAWDMERRRFAKEILRCKSRDRSSTACHSSRRCMRIRPRTRRIRQTTTVSSTSCRPS